MSKPKDRPVKFTVYLDAKMHRALRIRAIEEDTPATKLVERLIASYLNKPARRGSSR